jgi:hypothetical protein
MRSEIALGQDHGGQVVIRVPQKAEGHGPYAVRVNFVRFMLQLPGLTFGASTSNQLWTSLTAVVPTRWEADTPVPAFGTIVALGNVPATVGTLVWYGNWKWLTNAAAEPIWSAEGQWDATPWFGTCSSINVVSLISGLTSWTGRLLVDYDIVEVSPEDWRHLLPG